MQNITIMLIITIIILHAFFLIVEQNKIRLEPTITIWIEYILYYIYIINVYVRMQK